MFLPGIDRPEEMVYGRNTNLIYKFDVSISPSIKTHLSMIKEICKIQLGEYDRAKFSLRRLNGHNVADELGEIKRHNHDRQEECNR